MATETSVTHTLGPWTVGQRREPIRIYSRFGSIATVGGEAPDDETRSNALLIAASPMLFASCKELREVCAVAMRVIVAQGPPYLIDLFEHELQQIGIRDGFGVRADQAIALAERGEP